MSRFARINEDIRASELRVIDQEGHQLGVMSKAEALQAAKEQDLDLVEISPDASPPVAKIIDWGKYKYQRNKQQQRNKRQTKTPDLKQMRMGLKISDHDLGVKLKKVAEFLEEGHKVKVFIVYRGRELAHKEIGYQLAKRVMEMMSEIAVVDQDPVFAGRQLSFVLRRTNAKKT